MRSVSLLALAAAATAFVTPDQQVFAELKPDTRPDHSGELKHDDQPFKHYGQFLEDFREGLGSAFQAAEDSFAEVQDEISELGSSAISSMEDFVDEVMTSPHPFWDEAMEESADRPHHPDHPHHPPHKSEYTIYQLISKSKYTTKFAKLVDEYDFKDLLNKTAANITVFVPSDKAFEKIPDHGKKPPKEFVEALLKFHILPETYPAGRIFGSHTLPTLLDGDRLSGSPEETPQRLSVKLGLKGIYLGAYNRITFRDIFASNGIVHAVETFNIPPPPVAVIVGLVPTAFSTFELGLRKTGLGKIGKKPHLGATVFAPANSAWKGLGWKANAFLFSKFGRKYLKGLLAYHIVANQTLYSDTFYGPESDSEPDAFQDANAIPKGRYHLDLPTLLPGKSVGVDVGYFGRLVDIHVNHYSRVAFQDAIGRDGVLHVVNKVLIPPHEKKTSDAAPDTYDGGEISVEELKARLEPYVEHCDDKKSHGWSPMELL